MSLWCIPSRPSWTMRWSKSLQQKGPRPCSAPLFLCGGTAEQESVARNSRWRCCWTRWRLQKFKWRSQLIKSTTLSWTHLHGNWWPKIGDRCSRLSWPWFKCYNSSTIIYKSYTIHIIFRFPSCKDSSSKRLRNWGCTNTNGADLCAFCWCRKPLKTWDERPRRTRSTTWRLLHFLPWWCGVRLPIPSDSDWYGCD